MNCDKYRERISELIDVETHREEETEIYRHLAECSSCRHFFRSCLQMKEAVQSIPYYESPVEHTGNKTGMMKTFIRVPLPAAAVFVVLFIAGLIGTSYHFIHEDGPAAPEQHQVIYISDYPDIEIQLMID